MKRSTSVVLLALALAVWPEFWSQGPGGVRWASQGSSAAEPVQANADQAAYALRPDQVKLLRDALSQASLQGFGDSEFWPASLDGLLASPDPAQRGRGQAVLAAAIVRYASALHRGRLANAGFDPEWGMRPAPFDAQASFEQALADNRLQAWLTDLAPPYLGYQQLIDGLKVYRDIVARGGWRPVAAGPSMKLGLVDPRVPALRDRLAAEDPQAAKSFADARAAQAVPPSPAPGAAPLPPPNPLLFDETLDAAVKTFQRRHGLDADGVVAKDVLQALNISAQERVDQILANMERWRWVPPTLPPDRVQVNIAAAILTLFANDTPLLSMRAVAGRVTDHTPILQSTITSIEFNPPWNVPSSIAAKELWPKENANPGYLAREDFAVIRTGDGGVRLQQRAGPKSALGQVKFEFDNPYGVYLHDTPTHSTFARDSRLVSHGCVRLEQPKALAAALLQPNAGWTADMIDATIADGKTQWVKLQGPTAVLIFYWTAFAGPDGAMNFRADPYGWDRELLQRIAAGRSSKA